MIARFQHSSHQQHRITNVVATTPRGGLISGLAGALMLDGWTTKDLTFKSGLGLVVNWPSMVYAPSGFARVT